MWNVIFLFHKHRVLFHVNFLFPSYFYIFLFFFFFFFYCIFFYYIFLLFFTYFPVGRRHSFFSPFRLHISISFFFVSSLFHLLFLFLDCLSTHSVYSSYIIVFFIHLFSSYLGRYEYSPLPVSLCSIFLSYGSSLTCHNVWKGNMSINEHLT